MGCMNQRSLSASSIKQGDTKPRSKERFTSSILTNENMNSIVKSMLKKQIANFNDKDPQVSLLMRGSESGFTAKKFHQSTDGKTNTLLIVRTTKGNIFGAYTPCSWKNSVMYQFQSDLQKQSFLFALNKEAEDKWKSQIFKIQEKECAIMNCQNQGPIFGAGHDLHLTDECNKNQNWANIGKSYACSHKFGSNKANTKLAKQVRFFVEDLEIWELKNLKNSIIKKQ